MRLIILLLGTMFLLTLVAFPDESLSQSMTHLWSQRFGDASSQHGQSVVFDPSRNVAITGALRGTVDFGGGPLTSAGRRDIFLAKFDASGNHLWSQRFGDAEDQVVWSVAFDPSGNVAITGWFEGTVDFGGGPLTNTGGLDIFLAKFDASGTHLWSQRFGDATYQFGWSVAFDPSGNVAITGFFGGTVDFGGGPLTSAGVLDIFLAKFDASGTHLWSQRFGDAEDQLGYCVAFDPSGNVAITGGFWSSVDFGGGPLTSAGFEDIFLAKFDASGTHLWSQSFGDASSQHGQSVAFAPSRNIAITGSLRGTVDFGGGSLTSAGFKDIFLAKFDAIGNHLWSQRFGDAEDQHVRSVAFDPSGNVAITGGFEGSVDFGGGPLTSAGETDIFLVQFDVSGAHLWSQSFGDASSQHGQSVAFDPSGNVAITGALKGTVDFGGGPLTSAGGRDIFLAKFGPSCQPICDQRTQGFWRRVCKKPHPEELNGVEPYVGEIVALGSPIFDGFDAGDICDLMKVSPPENDMCRKARRQFMALLLNVASGRMTTCQELTDGSTVQDAIDQIKTLLDSPDHGSCERAKIIADDINNSRTLLDCDPNYSSAGPNNNPTSKSSPNPFISSTKIIYKIIDPVVDPENSQAILSTENPQRIELRIYDLMGREVRTLVDGVQPTGNYSVNWDGKNYRGENVPSGVYFYRLQSGNFSVTKKLIILK
jgi:uncharacterized protein (AIM24 family)